MTIDEFMRHVQVAMQSAGYDTKGEQHPEDWSANLTPVMQAWAMGFGVGYSEGRQANG